MKGYKPTQHRIAFGFVALAMATITIGAFGLAPAAIEPANALASAATAPAMASACNSNVAEPELDRHSTRASTTRPPYAGAHPRASRFNHPS